MTRRNRRRQLVDSALICMAESLEARSLLTAAIPAIQIDNQAPEVLGELNGNALLFVEDNGATRLYSSDGTQAGTTLITSISAVVDRSVQTEAVAGNLFFVAFGPDGAELWKSDGRAGGTMQVVDLNPGAANASPKELTAYDGQLYFAATTAADGRELFRTDGTASGTVLAPGAVSGTEGIGPTELHVFDNVLFYSSTATLDLHRTNGTQAGTSMFAEGTLPALPEGDRYLDIGTYVVGEVNGRMIVHRTTGNEFTQVRHLLSYSSASDTNPQVLVGFGLGDRIQPGFTHYAISNERLIFQETWYFTLNAKQPPWNTIWYSDGTTAGTHDVDQFTSRFTPAAGVMPGAFRGNTMYTTLQDQWADNGRPLEFYYSTPASIGSVDTGTNSYFVNEESGNFFIRKANAANDGLELVQTSSNAISKPVSMLGELYFTVTNGSESTLWKIDESAQLDPGPMILTPEANPGANTEHVGFYVDVVWAATTDAVSYDVQVTTVVDGVEKLNDSAAGIASTTVTMGVDPGPATVAVRANKSDGSVTDWSRRNFANRISPPTVTSPARQVTEQNPRIEWTAVDGAVSYEVWIAKDGKFLTRGTVTNNSALASELFANGNTNPFTEGAVNRIWVRANFASGVQTSWSNNYDFVKASDGLLPAVAVYRTGYGAAQDIPIFEWELREDAATHEISINRLGDRSTAVYQRTGLTSNIHQLETRLPGGTFEVWARTRFADGSVTRWGTSPLRHVAPVARPTITRATHDATTNTLNVEWDSPDSNVTYEIYVAPRENWRAFVVNETGLTANTYSTTIALTEPHRVWVRATDSQNATSYWSYAGDVTSPDLTDALTVTVTLEDGASDPTPLLEWDGLANVDHYQLYIRRPGTDAYTRNLTTNSHEVDEALPAGENTVWVRAVFSNGGTTKWGDGTKFQISSSFSDTEPEFSIANNVATWPTVTGATHYEIWVNQLDAQGRTILIRAFHLQQKTGNQQILEMRQGTYRGWLRAFSSDQTATKWSAAINFTVASSVEHDHRITEPLNILSRFVPPVSDEAEAGHAAEYHRKTPQQESPNITGQTSTGYVDAVFRNNLWLAAERIAE